MLSFPSSFQDPQIRTNTNTTNNSLCPQPESCAVFLQIPKCLQRINYILFCQVPAFCGGTRSRTRLGRLKVFCIADMLYPQFIPSKLCSSFSAMTISAPNFTFLNFFLYSLPGIRDPHHFTNCSPF